ncbi:MAG TPA: hypothetical protein VGL34_16605 [Steroidobacteraceae bacterium]|jgi:hypothetical protein
MPAWDLERNGEIVRIVPKGPFVTIVIDLELGAARASPVQSALRIAKERETT